MSKNDTRQALARELAEERMIADKMLHEEIGRGPYPYKLDHFMGPALEFVDKVFRAAKETEENPTA